MGCCCTSEYQEIIEIPNVRKFVIPNFITRFEYKTSSVNEKEAIFNKTKGIFEELANLQEDKDTEKYLDKLANCHDYFLYSVMNPLTLGRNSLICFETTFDIKDEEEKKV